MSTLTARFKLPNTVTPRSLVDSEILPVRVKDIILDDSHPEYEKYGGIDSIGVIKYSLIDRKIDTTDSEKLPAAYPISNFNSILPLINEVVLLVLGPKEYPEPEKSIKFEKVDYYISTLNMYNEVNYSPFLDEFDQGEKSPGYDFKANNQIRPLQPYNGDVIFQGRNGQAIRLTGAKSTTNSLTNNSNANKPLTIITNGHPETRFDKLYIEDINKDLSSIYMTSDHIIPLEQSRDKYAGANKRPTLANSFRGPQIIVNSGRLFFNSTEESILFSAKEEFGVTSKDMFLDAVNYIGLDAKKIYLGEDARRFEFQPAILGTQLETFLQSLLGELESIGSAMKKAKTIDGKIIPKLNIAGVSLEESIKILKKWTNPGGESLLKSKKVFVE